MDAEQEEQAYLKQVRKDVREGLLDFNHLGFENCRSRRNQLKRDCEAKDAEIERLQAELDVWNKTALEIADTIARGNTETSTAGRGQNSV